MTSTSTCTPGEDTSPVDVGADARLKAALVRMRELMREGLEPNLRRQLAWLGVREGEVIALQTLGRSREDVSCLALARGIDEALRLAGNLVGSNRWGREESIQNQGVYLVMNKLVGRIDEVFVPGVWSVMPKGVITDARVIARLCVYLDLDTQRFDERGKPVDLPISATRDELCRTIARSLVIQGEIVGVLAAVGIDRPGDVVAIMMSGNGVQLWLALDEIPESPELHALLKELLAIWAALYDSEVSHVDTAVHDAKRIGPLAGTPKKKGVKKELYRRVTFDGAHTPRRLTMDELQAVVSYHRKMLTAEQRAAVAKTLGVRPTRPATRAPTGGRQQGGLSACNAVPIREVATRLAIDPDKPVCPGCGSGGSGSDVAFLDELNLLNCKHNRCSERPNRTPVDLVAKVAFGCDNLAGTKGLAKQVCDWFEAELGRRP